MNVTRRNFLKTGAAVASAVGALKAQSIIGRNTAEAQTVAKPTYSLTKAVERFSPQNTMFARAFWDKDYVQARKSLKQRPLDVKKELDAIALNFSGWWIHGVTSPFCAFGVPAAMPLMRWDDKLLNMTAQKAEYYSRTRFEGGGNPMVWDDKPAEMRYDADPEVLTRKVKNAALFLGATEVGVARLNPNWVNSGYFDFRKREAAAWPKDPAEFKYAISLAIAMDYDSQRDITSYYASGSTGLGYSTMVEVASAVAKFVRVMGYPAIPVGNDTCTNVPIAIDAGLGEIGRNGLLITPKYGPRVRLCTVLTDMPLVPDHPIDFGVIEFCNNCGKCAETCPNGAIWTGELTDKTRNISNRSGVVRWPLNAEKCFDYWRINRAACNCCVPVCPFSKRSDIWFHRIMPKVIDKLNSGPLNSLFVKLDDLLGYGDRKLYHL